MADQLAEAFGIVTIHSGKHRTNKKDTKKDGKKPSTGGKTYGHDSCEEATETAAPEQDHHGVAVVTARTNCPRWEVDKIAAHTECARSQSSDSGVVADIDQEDRNSVDPSRNGFPKGAHSLHLQPLHPGNCQLSVITQEPMRSMTNGDTSDFEPSVFSHGPSLLSRQDSLCERTSLNGHVILEESEADQSQDSIQTDLEVHNLEEGKEPDSPHVHSQHKPAKFSVGDEDMDGCVQSTDSDQPPQDCHCSCEEISQSNKPKTAEPSCTKCSCSPHSKNRKTRTSCQRTLEARSLNLSLGDEMPERRRHRSQRAADTANQSWLLRLFESKLFDMSIAITYLFNSKEPGVQTYIGESRCGAITVQSPRVCGHENAFVGTCSWWFILPVVCNLWSVLAFSRLL